MIYFVYKHIQLPLGPKGAEMDPISCRRWLLLCAGSLLEPVWCSFPRSRAGLGTVLAHSREGWESRELHVKATRTARSPPRPAEESLKGCDHVLVYEKDSWPETGGSDVDSLSQQSFRPSLSALKWRAQLCVNLNQFRRDNVLVAFNVILLCRGVGRGLGLWT